MFLHCWGTGSGPKLAVQPVAQKLESEVELESGMLDMSPVADASSLVAKALLASRVGHSTMARPAAFTQLRVLPLCHFFFLHVCPGLCTLSSHHLPVILPLLPQKVLLGLFPSSAFVSNPLLI